VRFANLAEIVAERIDGYCRWRWTAAPSTGDARGGAAGGVAGGDRDRVGRSPGRESSRCWRRPGIAQLFATVCHVGRRLEGKPHPEGYLIALRGCKRRCRAGAGEVVVIEDTEAGVTAAKAAAALPGAGGDDAGSRLAAGTS